MTARRILIDCDPGQDDAVMLLLALASPEELEIAAITTVAGNVPLALTQRNARLVCELAGRGDVPVHAGCARPMVRDPITAEHVHGASGIDGMAIREPALALAEAHGIDAIIAAARSAGPAGLTLVPTGPLTNVGMALVKAPEIADNIAEIVLMGGAWREAGNITPSAEFNIRVDPHAAHVVFTCGRPITVLSLDASHQVLTTTPRMAAIGAIGGAVARATHDMLRFYDRHDVEKYGSPGAPLHDPLTIAFLLRPDLFAAKHVHVGIEIHSEASMGATMVDFWGVTDQPANAHWVHTVDADGFYTLLGERLARL